MTNQELFDNFREMTPGCVGAEDFIDNYSGYICDAIQEIADSNIDIYYADLREWFCDNDEYVTRAIDEFGWDGCGRDIYKAIQMGQYEAYTEELYENLDELIVCYALKHAFDTIEDFSIFEDVEVNDFIDSISDLVRNIDNNDSFEDIDELVDSYVQDTILEKEEEIGL